MVTCNTDPISSRQLVLVSPQVPRVFSRPNLKKKNIDNSFKCLYCARENDESFFLLQCRQPATHKFHIYIPYDGETCQLFTTLHLLTTPVPVVHRHIKWWPRLQCFQCWLFLSNSKMRISFFFTCAEELESSRAHWVSSLPAQENKWRNKLAWEKKHKKFKRCINCSEHLRCQL